MSTYLANPFIRLIVILGLSLVFHAILAPKIKNILIPWSVAFLVLQQNVVPFIGGFPHFLLMVVYWISMAIVLDGCNVRMLQNNKAMFLFGLYWFYMILMSLASDYVYYATMYHINAYVELFLVGYFAGIWVMKTPNGMRRLLFAVAVVSIFVYATYAKYGFVGMTDHLGRAMLDAELKEQELGTNVNAIGLAVAPIFVLMLIGVVTLQKRGTVPIIRYAFPVSLLVAFYFMIRTGSRNAGLVILPALYFFFKTRAPGRGSKKFAVAFVLVVGVISVIALFKYQAQSSESGISRLRIFQLKGDDMHTDYTLETMSSGRISTYIEFLRDMNGIDYLIGKGPAITRNYDGSMFVSGGMSIYVGTFHNTGIIGVVLMALYFIYMYTFSQKNGNAGKMALLLFAAWAVTGVAESAGISRGQIMRLVQGMSVAFCSGLPLARKWRYEMNQFGENYGEQYYGT